MAATNSELSNIFDQFYRLKNAGQKTNLYVGCEASGQVFVNLQVHLDPPPHVPAQHFHRHQGRSEHHYHRPEAAHSHRPHHESHHRHHGQPRARPSHLRRLERREQARAAVTAKKAAADQVFVESDTPPPNRPVVKAVKTIAEEAAQVNRVKAAAEAVNVISVEDTALAPHILRTICLEPSKVNPPFPSPQPVTEEAAETTAETLEEAAEHVAAASPAPPPSCNQPTNFPHPFNSFCFSPTNLSPPLPSATSPSRRAMAPPRPNLVILLR